MKVFNFPTKLDGEKRRVTLQQFRAHHAIVKPSGDRVRVKSGFTTKWDDGVYRTPEGYECCSWCGHWHMGKAEQAPIIIEILEVKNG